MSSEVSLETRERMLSAAGRIFAAKGFKAATVREICQHAGVNVAAVNYYFGDKERLYIESVKRAHALRVERVPIPSWPPGTPPERKLRDFIRTLLIRVLEEPSDQWHGTLMLREMSQPTGACVELVRDYIGPHFALLLGVLDELLPATVAHEQRQLLAFSVVGQCVFHRMAQPVVRLLVGPEEHAKLGAERLAEHIWRFTLAGLQSAGAAPDLETPMPTPCGATAEEGP
jgi:AcrR family transcriptional regulator